MVGIARVAALALVAFGATVGITASATTSPAASASSASSAEHHAKRARPHKGHTKKKKRTRHASANTPRATPHLAFATDVASLVDESQLPPVVGGSCPPEMASIDGRYCIDKWEGSLVEMGGGAGHEDAIFPYTSTVEGHVVRAVSVPGAWPQGYISGVEASQACANAGKRLCSRVEWRKACVGPQNKQFGYGDAREHGRCNDHGRSPMHAIYGFADDDDPGFWSPEKMNDPRLNALAGSLAKTGDHPDCTNDYGVFDMVGNLHEWTSDPDGTFQGGYYLDTSINGDGCAYRTTAHDFAYHDYSTGFRCCADPR